ncbi:hypothetical protein J0S82_004254, partial [Galemys pyrenaicus]
DGIFKAELNEFLTWELAKDVGLAGWGVDLCAQRRLGLPEDGVEPLAERRHALVPFPSSVCVANTQEVLLWQGRSGVLRVVVKKDRRSRCPGSSEDRARPRRFAEGLTIRSGP